jgi:GNAT superfamily N-acetyltransferase
VAITETTFGGRPELVDSTGIMDYGSLIYIALQRSRTAREAIKVMTELVAAYGYYSGGEAIGILHSDETVCNAFHAANYRVSNSTTWFHLDLQNYTPVITAETIAYYRDVRIDIKEISKAKTWWEGCTQATGLWFDAIAYLIRDNRPIARLRVRVAVPDTGNILTLYEKTWFASLLEIRVHPDFENTGIKKFLLGEVIQYLAAQNQIIQVEAHTVENSPLCELLRGQSWLERDHGSVFVKTVS